MFASHGSFKRLRAGVTMAFAQALLSLLHPVHTAASPADCAAAAAQRIPARSTAAPGGRDFARTIAGLAGDDREAMIRHELMMANIPDFLRHFVPVSLRANRPDGSMTEIVICAAPDYLAIGSDTDYVLMPMRLETALLAADRFGLTLPTPRVVDAIYSQASVHLVPQPLPAGDAMRSTEYYVHHNSLIAAQRATLSAAPGAFTAGHKKDVVLTRRLWQNLDRVAIYGWQLAEGEPIQPLSTVHGWRYADYSHGARLIGMKVWVDGVPRSIYDVLQDPTLARVLSSEGAITNMMRLVSELRSRATVAAF
jgi:hypothetical protein